MDCIYLTMLPMMLNLFNQSMQNHTAIVMKKILEIYKGFKELKKLVDVASCLGANMSLIVNTYPQITGINFDLPYVIKNAPCSSSVEHVEGDMFVNVPSGQAIFTKILQNRLWLQTSIEAVKWLAKQACAFRGHDESIKSSNSGNFIKMIKYSARMNKDIVDAVLENASGSAKYTSSDIQKELLNIISNRVWQKIREEIGDAKFCILVDEAQD
ncbi:caffeate O-methyltransferase-like protein 2 [Citrus sinensis]|uniref:caffeate O-methyltransferase-like protein 2 n=1 Tax=Citrus sinensis TaxID=2711 RepID=UPI002277D941|nr:caffeate O-methyltransferase-like protein 2 [Citrus sinensis]